MTASAPTTTSRTLINTNNKAATSRMSGTIPAHNERRCGRRPTSLGPCLSPLGRRCRTLAQATNPGQPPPVASPPSLLEAARPALVRRQAFDEDLRRARVPERPNRRYPAREAGGCRERQRECVPGDR